MAFQKAERKRSKARIALIGASGSGKSYSALVMAKGLGGKIAAIDTENGSLSLYSDLTGFDVCELQPPYTPERYIELIRQAERAGYDTIIIDSLTHEWSGVGGLLEIHDAMPGNGWANWAKITPRHQAMIDVMLQSKCHIIATMRSKTEYSQTETNGKKTIEKIGTAPQQRDGMDYEFTLVLDLQQNHVAAASKDRTGLFDGQFAKVTEDHGARLRAWLEGGVEAPARTEPTPTPQQTTSPKPLPPDPTDEKTEDPFDDGLHCSECNEPITEDVRDYSVRRFGKPLCRKHQVVDGAQPKPADPNALSTEPQQRKIHILFTQKGMDDNWLHENFGTASTKKLTKAQASTAIEKLMAMQDAPPPATAPMDMGDEQPPFPSE